MSEQDSPGAREGRTSGGTSAGEAPARMTATSTPRRPSRVPVDGARVPSWLATASAWTWRLLLMIVGAAAVLVVLAQLYLVTLPIILALILCTLLVPIARALEHRRVPRMLSATIVVVGAVGGFAGLVAALVPSFVDQMGDLRESVAAGIDDGLQFLEDQFGWDEAEITGMVQDGLALLQEQSGQIIQQALTGAAIVGQSVAALVLALVLLFFFIKDGAQIVDWILDRSPDLYRDTVSAVGRRAWIALSGFIRGTALVALVDAIGIGVGLAVLGVPAALPIAVLVFFGGFIPVIGAFVTGMLAVLVALAHGGLQLALIVLAIVVAVQQFESNVLQPVIMRRAVSLHPVVILSALTAGASIMGIIGAFLAVPVAAVASAVANELRLRHEASMIANDPDVDGDAHVPLGDARYHKGRAHGDDPDAHEDDPDAHEDDPEAHEDDGGDEEAPATVGAERARTTDEAAEDPDADSRER